MLDPRLSDVHVLSLTLFGEVRSASLDEIIAMAWLVRNQVLTGGEYRQICLAYPCWSEASGNHDTLIAIMQQLLEGTVTDPRYMECAWVVTGVINGYCRDPLKGCTLSHPATMVPRPEWATTKIPVVNYAKQTFYTEAGAS